MNRYRWVGRITLAAVMLVIVAALVVGCGGSKTSTTTQAGGPPAKGTASEGLSVAKSSLSTMAPDAKLLVVQTAQPTSPTAAPVWGYLWGSPKTGKVYLVFVSNGQSMGAREYAEAKLSTEEWAKIPADPTWKIDSPEAYTKAIAVSGAKGAPDQYMMGMITYKSPEDTSSVQPFVWNVQLNPGSSGATTTPIDVNANTGQAAVAKSGAAK